MFGPCLNMAEAPKAIFRHVVGSRPSSLSPCNKLQGQTEATSPAAAANSQKTACTRVAGRSNVHKCWP